MPWRLRELVGRVAAVEEEESLEARKESTAEAERVVAELEKSS